jgi:hypothetical protein
MTKRKTTGKSDTYMVLGVSSEGLGYVAVVTNAEDAEAAKKAYTKHYPKYSPVSWPSLTDLQESVRILALARDRMPTGRDDLPVLNAGGPDPWPSKKDPSLTADGHGCPNFVLNALYAIRVAAVDRGLEDPFGNNGAEISTPAFDAKAYRWEPPSRGAFWWRDIHITWYKHVERDCRSNRSISVKEAEEMQDECIASIVLMEKDES